MPKGQRITVFLSALAILGVGYFFYRTPVNELGDKGILIMSALIMLSFSTLLAEHYFTRPTDVVASSVSILLLLSPLYASLREMGVWYWIFWGYSAFLLLTSLVSLLLLNSKKPPSSTSNRISSILKTFSTHFGAGRFLWFVLFALCVLFYVDNQSAMFLVLFGYCAVLLLINPKKALIKTISLSSSINSEIATLFSVQAGNSFLARMHPEALPVSRFDAVGFTGSKDGSSAWTPALVIDAYQLNDERWLRILSDESFAELSDRTQRPAVVRAGAVHLLQMSQPLEQVSRLAGVVCEGATIEKLKFEYLFNAKVQEGDLLETKCGDTNVLFQVVEGITGTEMLESKDEAGIIVGEAVQLGIWNAGTRSFDRFGWVPQMNTPVFIASDIEAPAPLSSEYQIGQIPNTQFPVFIDKDAAVTHHLAVLGITGSGKSVFSRNLVRQIADQGTKVICVDFTNEYGVRLGDLIDGPLISGKAASDLFEAVDDIGIELDKFPNQRDRTLIDRREGELREGFKTALGAFVASDVRATLFELPDVTNSTGILEYTRWFFRSLFDLARADELNGKRICVVLEEAHTIVPEWNFLGIDDKRSSSVVNSISQIALQGRKYNVGFVVIAQRTANVSKTVLTQCNSVVACQQFDKTSADFLGNYMGSDFIDSLTRLKPRHAIAVGKAFSSGTPMIFSVPDIAEPDGDDS